MIDFKRALHRYGYWCAHRYARNQGVPLEAALLGFYNLQPRKEKHV